MLVDDGQPDGAQAELADPGRHLVDVVRPVPAGQPVTGHEPRLSYAGYPARSIGAHPA